MSDDLQQAQGQPPTDPRVVRRGMIKEAARASDSYGLLLFLVLVDYLILSIGRTGPATTVIATVLICATALLGFHTSHVRGRLLDAVRIASVVAIVSSIVASIVHGDLSKGVTFLVVALLITVTPIAVVTRIVKHRRVTAETLLGAVAVYVLLGLVFAYADYAVQLLQGQSFFVQSGSFTGPDFVYYSFITMTTVGYGDLTPTTGVPRTFAVLEALTGQIFLVVMVSRLVALYTPRTAGERRRMLAAGLSGAVDETEEPDLGDGGDGADEDGGSGGPDGTGELTT